ncbi:MAG: ion transporter [Methylococcales bacterium]|nr:ion transporter [Methylococcales bacterium]MCK5925871.1 ion transporter [Methylococcales bacterium]
MHNFVHSIAFMVSINIVIIINAILIGVETHYSSSLVSNLQAVALAIFTIEIILRYIGKESVKAYFSSGWNLFDIVIVSICYIPETWFINSAALSVFRIMRVFRILRLVKTFPELKIIVNVLLKSLKSLFYTFMLLFIFMYMYAVMGVILFKGGPAANGTEIGAQSPDPYGTITEAFFTLFRITTGEDWTDLRYNLLGGQVEGASDAMISIYHVSWMGLSAFLLINLVVGAVVNNYDQVMIEIKSETETKLNVDDLYAKIESLSQQINELKTEIKK